MTILSALGGRSRLSLPVIVGVTLVAIAVIYALIVGAMVITP